MERLWELRKVYYLTEWIQNDEIDDIAKLFFFTLELIDNDLFM